MATNFKLPEGLCITGGSMAAMEKAAQIIQAWSRIASVPVLIAKDDGNVSVMLDFFEEGRKTRTPLIWLGPRTIASNEDALMRIEFAKLDFKMIEIRVPEDQCTDVWNTCSSEIVRKWIVLGKFETIEFSENDVTFTNRLSNLFL